jgi:hypothetical protein
LVLAKKLAPPPPPSATSGPNVEFQPTMPESVAPCAKGTEKADVAVSVGRPVPVPVPEE